MYPWHPAIVHFPIAAWVPTPVLDLTAIVGSRPALELISVNLVLIGLGSAVVAGAVGVVDAVRAKPGAAAMATLSNHVTVIAAAFTAFGLSALVEPGVGPSGTDVSAWLRLALNGLGTAALLVGGHLGASLVHVHRLPNHNA